MLLCNEHFPSSNQHLSPTEQKEELADALLGMIDSHAIYPFLDMIRLHDESALLAMVQETECGIFIAAIYAAEWMNFYNSNQELCFKSTSFTICSMHQAGILVNEIAVKILHHFSVYFDLKPSEVLLIAFGFREYLQQKPEYQHILNVFGWNFSDATC